MLIISAGQFIQRAATRPRQQRTKSEQVTATGSPQIRSARASAGAAARTAALNERFLRRFSAELHDGPAQEISLALLRLDHLAALAGASERDESVTTEIERELDVIQGSLRRSLKDVRATSSGLLLPHLGALNVEQTLEHVVRAPTTNRSGGRDRTARSSRAGAAGHEDRSLPDYPRGVEQRLATATAWRRLHSHGVHGGYDRGCRPRPVLDPTVTHGSETHLGS